VELPGRRGHGLAAQGDAAGVLAAVVSFLQVAFMIGIYVHVGQHGDAESSRTLFNAINKADTIKLILLAVFVGAASWAASLYPEQSHYQAAVSPPEYDRWMTMVCASFARGQVPNSGP
jgi:hypothetical protein